MNKKKKILILSCQGGGGHMSAATAIESYLQDYETHIVDIMGDTLVFLDPLYFFTAKRFCGQDLYNFLLQRNYKRLINFFSHIGSFLIFLNKRRLHRSILRYLKKERPHLIISVIPFLNSFFAQAAEELNIPCLIVPTDFDIYTFIKDVKASVNNNVHICLGLDTQEIRKPLMMKKTIHTNMVHVTGFPIRKIFFTPKDKKKLKAAFGIVHDKPVVLVIMGATGSPSLLEYLKYFVKLELPCHLIACIGRSTYLHDLLIQYPLPDHLSLSVIDHNSDISDAMAIADLAISKPGSVTFAEMLYMNIPIIIDNTTPALLWERLNLDLINTHNLGSIITNYKQTPELITHYLTNSGLRQKTQKNIQALEKKEFEVQFKQLLEKIFSSPFPKKRRNYDELV